MSEERCHICGEWDGKHAYTCSVYNVPSNRELVEQVYAKKDAQIAALTERLRAVEAERDEAILMLVRSTGTSHTLKGVALDNLRYIKRLEDGEAEREAHLEDHSRQLSALRAELQHKDAALKKVLPWLERETPPQYVGVNSEGLPVEYEPTAAEEACGMAAMVILEALQPKEPPCQTA